MLILSVSEMPYSFADPPESYSSKATMVMIPATDTLKNQNLSRNQTGSSSGNLASFRWHKDVDRCLLLHDHWWANASIAGARGISPWHCVTKGC